MSSKMVSWKGSEKSSRRRRSRSPSPGRGSSARSPSYKTPSQRTPSYKTPSASATRSSRGVRSSSAQRQQSPEGFVGNPSTFTPRTTDELRTREAKVERRRLQAEAKSHKLAMRQQIQDLRHMKRTQGLEYAAQHRETYGITPMTKYGIIAGVAALVGYFTFF